MQHLPEHEPDQFVRESNHNERWWPVAFDTATCIRPRYCGVQIQTRIHVCVNELVSE